MAVHHQCFVFNATKFPIHRAAPSPGRGGEARVSRRIRRACRTAFPRRGMRVLQGSNRVKRKSENRAMRNWHNSHFVDFPRANPPCRARCPLHRATVRQAVSMLAETHASPPTLPFAGEGAVRASVDVNASSNNSFPRQRGKAGMGAMLADMPPSPPCLHFHGGRRRKRRPLRDYAHKFQTE